ncbi:uncharacterized protein LOC124269095 [Haliotis rubra]|uniref:uncharacterized protein LOC124269095 n=1 Tax=Haliotis rubra TaxID=36100 RepID=UPI001EE5FA5B|nr:uncharacterized protein LOC124269095 [Haliotis rubra]
MKERVKMTPAKLSARVQLAGMETSVNMFPVRRTLVRMKDRVRMQPGQLSALVKPASAETDVNWLQSAQMPLHVKTVAPVRLTPLVSISVSVFRALEGTYALTHLVLLRYRCTYGCLLLLLSSQS